VFARITLSLRPGFSIMRVPAKSPNRWLYVLPDMRYELTTELTRMPWAR
jgi:hypothetical protein